MRLPSLCKLYLCAAFLASPSVSAASRNRNSNNNGDILFPSAHSIPRGGRTACWTSSSTTSGQRCNSGYNQSNEFGIFGYPCGDGSPSRAQNANKNNGQNGMDTNKSGNCLSAFLNVRGGSIAGSTSSFTQLRDFWGTFLTFAKSSPYIIAFASCALNGFAGDLIAQSAEALTNHNRTSQLALSAPRAGGGPMNSTEGVENAAVATLSLPPSHRSFNIFPVNYNPRRSLAFIMYGGMYQGVSLEIIYNNLFTAWFGRGNTLLKVCVSQFIMAPFLTLPMAYCFKGMVFGKSIDQTLQDYWVGITEKGLLFSFWKLWIPIQFLVFAVIPVRLRIPFSAFFSFLWTIMLSRISNH